jgi:hypothetical protein
MYFYMFDYARGGIMLKKWFGRCSIHSIPTNDLVYRQLERITRSTLYWK